MACLGWIVIDEKAKLRGDHPLKCLGNRSVIRCRETTDSKQQQQKATDVSSLENSTREENIFGR